jgi:hypothetical protein
MLLLAEDDKGVGWARNLDGLSSGASISMSHVREHSMMIGEVGIIVDINKAICTVKADTVSSSIKWLLSKASVELKVRKLNFINQDWILTRKSNDSVGREIFGGAQVETIVVNVVDEHSILGSQHTRSHVSMISSKTEGGGCDLRILSDEPCKLAVLKQVKGSFIHDDDMVGSCELLGNVAPHASSCDCGRGAGQTNELLIHGCEGAR